jgi:hypothetical protein
MDPRWRGERMSKSDTASPRGPRHGASLDRTATMMVMMVIDVSAETGKGYCAIAGNAESLNPFASQPSIRVVRLLLVRQADPARCEQDTAAFCSRGHNVSMHYATMIHYPQIYTPILHTDRHPVINRDDRDSASPTFPTFRPRRHCLLRTHPPQ